MQAKTNTNSNTSKKLARYIWKDNLGELFKSALPGQQKRKNDSLFLSDFKSSNYELDRFDDVAVGTANQFKEKVLQER